MADPGAQFHANIQIVVMLKDWKGISAPDVNREGTGEVEK
jgi:hypothetical protein